MLWDRSTKIRGSVGDGLRKKARRLGEEVKLGKLCDGRRESPSEARSGPRVCVEPQQDDDGLSLG